MNKIDFRSDTVTWPTDAMRHAMAHAPVGDDVYGEDPTIKQLETQAAILTGKEAALFVASGTMGNLTAILSHTTRGDEAIVGEDAHIFCWEAGGMATLGGVTPRPLPTDAFGRMDLGQVERAIRADNPHLPRTRLICVENSYGGKHGYPIEPTYFAQMRQLAEAHQLRLHMDGARLFNAVTALHIPATEITQYVDSVTFCLSKGLCAPVGSILCGSADFIHQARRVRKSLGGGMRQAGILASAGLIALDEMIGRLPEDHRRARQLAQGLAKIDGVHLDLDKVKTNMVFFTVAQLPAEQLTAQLAEQAGILLGSDYGVLRAVTHYWITDAHVERFLTAVRQFLNP